MKLRKKRARLVMQTNADGTDDWWLALQYHEAKRTDGLTEIVVTKGYDVTESVRPYLNGNNTMMTRLENACYKLIRRCLILEGITPTDDAIQNEWLKYCEKEKADDLKETP